MNFIKAWQSLPDFGVSLFVVRFHGEKRDELLGVAYNRIMRMSLQTGDHLKTWRYNTIKVINFIFRNFNVKTMYCIFFKFANLLSNCKRKNDVTFGVCQIDQIFLKVKLLN